MSVVEHGFPGNNPRPDWFPRAHTSIKQFKIDIIAYLSRINHKDCEIEGGSLLVRLTLAECLQVSDNLLDLCSSPAMANAFAAALPHYQIAFPAAVQIPPLATVYTIADGAKPIHAVGGNMRRIAAPGVQAFN